MAKIWAIDPYHRSKRSRDARNGWAHRHVSVVELSTKTGSGRYLDLNYPECVNGNLMLAVVRAIANRQLACVEKPTILPWIFAAISHKIPDRSSQREQIEMLEQLRVLWYGEKIHVAVAEVVPGTGVDTPEDLERVRAELR